MCSPTPQMSGMDKSRLSKLPAELRDHVYEFTLSLVGP